MIRDAGPWRSIVGIVMCGMLLIGGVSATGVVADGATLADSNDDAVAAVQPGEADRADIDTAEETESATYDLSFDAGGTYLFGVPVPTDQTVGELFDDGMAFDGVIYAYDAADERWVRVGPDADVDALNAFYVDTAENVTVTIEVAGQPGDAPGIPPTADVAEGANVVAPPEASGVEEAFAATIETNVSHVTNPFAEPSVSPASEDAFADSREDPDAEVNPFAGYVIEAESDGSLAGNVPEGATQAEADELLGLDSDEE